VTHRPNFFVVGAPKCGTTSLYEALRQHPRAFMPYDPQNYWITKEPGFFCPELIARPKLAISDLASYLKLFVDAGGAERIGESSALYLFSKSAAAAIADFCPAAKIIIMLREPVAMMQAWHADNLRHGHEDVLSFQQAIELEPLRKRGERLPLGSGYPQCLQYRAMASFSQQIERYLTAFGHRQVKILLLEDLSRDARATVDNALEFLDLEPGYPAELSVHNERISLTQQQLFKHRLKNRLRGIAPVRWARSCVPANFDQWLESGLKLFTGARIDPIATAPPCPAFLAELHEEMSEEVDRLAELIDRDLSHWHARETSGNPVCSPE
jgi:hypothetical protein